MVKGVLEFKACSGVSPTFIRIAKGERLSKDGKPFVGRHRGVAVSVVGRTGWLTEEPQ